MSGSGFFIRWERAGKWDSLDITELTDEELAKFFSQAPSRQRVESWAVALVGWIRDNVIEAPSAGDA